MYQEVLSLPLMVALAAAILSVGALMVWHFQDAQKVADWAEAYAFPLAKPLNSTHFWLGVQAAFADVSIDRVVVDGREYPVYTKATYGRKVWLNYSGGPLVVKCNSTVEISVNRGQAGRVERFKTVCPTQVTSSVVFQENLNQFINEALAFADFAFEFLADQSLLAVDVIDNSPGNYSLPDYDVFPAVYNTWKWPLLVYYKPTGLGYPDYPTMKKGPIFSNTPPGPWGIFNADYSDVGYLVTPREYMTVGDPIGKVEKWIGGTVKVYFTGFATSNLGYLNGKIFTNTTTVATRQVLWKGGLCNLVGAGCDVPLYTITIDLAKSQVTARATQGTVYFGAGTIVGNPASGNGAFKIEVSIVTGSITPYLRAHIYVNRANDYAGYLIYAFPAQPVTVNTTASGPPYLKIGSQTIYGNTTITGAVGLSPVRVYGVEVRNNKTHWLVTVGVPGYDIVDNRSILSIIAKPGDFLEITETAGYVRVVTPYGVYVNKTPYYADPVPGFTMHDPVVAFLSPDGSLWAAFVGYRTSDKALLVKTNALLNPVDSNKDVCIQVEPGLYAIPRPVPSPLPYMGLLGENRCRAPNGAVIRYFVTSDPYYFNWKVAVEVRFPMASTYFPSVRYPGDPSPVVFAVGTVGNNIPPVYKYAPRKQITIKLGQTTAEAYVGGTLAKNATQFTIPTLYEISPRGLKPYLVVADRRNFCDGYTTRHHYMYIGLYYGGKGQVSYYQQDFSYYDDTCSGGSSFSDVNPCTTRVIDRFLGHAQYNLNTNVPGYKYAVEVRGLFQRIEVDCTGKVVANYNYTMTLYTVKSKTNTYGVYDGTNVCGLRKADKGPGGRVVCR